MNNTAGHAVAVAAEPRHTLLIVDDQPASLGFLVDHLEALGYGVIVARGGAEALRRVGFARPDLVLLDAVMPGVDGYEVCRQLQAQGATAELPVIFMTALEQTDARLSAFALGAVDYVAKPLQVDEVAARVAAHLQLRDARLALQQQTRQLQRVRLDLEREVAHRTAALEDSNRRLQRELAERGRDVTRLQDYQAQLGRLASRDSLTGLANRHSFRDSLARALAAPGPGPAPGRGAGRGGGVLLLGLDQFGDVNQGLGRAVGDRLLARYAAALVQAAGAHPVARTGGDEFAVLVGADGPGQLARRLLRLLARPVEIDGYQLAVGCSIGIALAPPEGADAETLLCQADAAMRRAKAAGGNRYQYYTAAMNNGARRRLALGNALRHAIGRAELSLHYQPRTSLDDGAAVGMEALLRWNCRLLGPVEPAEFIPLAEQNGLILPIGAWVLEQACHQAQAWRLRGGAALPVAVNLSARQLRDDGLVRVVAAALAASGLPPQLLELELTESMLMHDAKRTLRTLAALKALGVRLAVDDFGTGYSSLSYLKSFPLDYLKIDRSFVSGLPDDRNDGAIVRAVIAMAHTLGLTVIAEGVESAAQLDFLQAQRCDQVQGYYFSRPLSVPAMDAFLAPAAAAVL